MLPQDLATPSQLVREEGQHVRAVEALHRGERRRHAAGVGRCCGALVDEETKPVRWRARLKVTETPRMPEHVNKRMQLLEPLYERPQLIAKTRLLAEAKQRQCVAELSAPRINLPRSRLQPADEARALGEGAAPTAGGGSSSSASELRAPSHSLIPPSTDPTSATSSAASASTSAASKRSSSSSM